MRKKFTIKLNIYLGSLLILLGLVIQYKAEIIQIFTSNQLNLSLAEIDTEYENNDSMELLSYIDPSWAWPTDSNYSITSTFSSYHPAIDIVTNGNLNVYSAYSGEVITNSYKGDNGNYLVIKQDNGYYIMYAHLSQKLVNQGEKVNKGQLIGIMGRTGYATGVHLHFAVWTGYPHNSTPINPYQFY